MKILDAIAEVESWFLVHEEMGMPAYHVAPDGTETDVGARDMGFAPCDEPYVTVMSGGVIKEGRQPPIMFRDEARAVSWWLYAVEDYAETLAPRAEWKKLHFYWRQKPVWEITTFVAINQAELLQSRSVLSSMLTVGLGIITSRLLISKLNPDGKED